jgi:hypothetical protein
MNISKVNLRCHIKITSNLLLAVAWKIYSWKVTERTISLSNSSCNLNNVSKTIWLFHHLTGEGFWNYEHYIYSPILPNITRQEVKKIG